MKNHLLLFLLFLAPFLQPRCTTDSIDEPLSFPKEVNFEISDHLFPGKVIKVLEARDEKNYGFAVGREVFLFRNGVESHHILSSDIMDLAWNEQDQSWWAGTHSSGLARIGEGEVTFFTQASHKLPRDLVSHVACDSNGRVWFSSSAHLLGGAGCYEEGSFLFFTPENSFLPDNLIKSIVCRGKKTWIATGGTVTRQKVVEITGDDWKLLPIEGYYLTEMDISSQSTLYVIDDVGLSSSFMNYKVYRLKDDKVDNILPEQSRFDFHPWRLKADLRDYLWLAGFGSGEKMEISVFDGEQWQEAPADFPILTVYCMAVDRLNGFWIGTDDGVYLLRQ
ncbi:MAG: hypothetical protein WBK43_10045 [Prolixibacteraceae bacterium]|jgi:ligand-binding sensor domain-containing protein|nr:hypothetical protein [Prolixibacteraceae bacterium]MDI9562914.1 hypothetical protein [Bacteroidota bacterium]NLS99849.1 hypothetical protein [Bacteroidales bacterium]HOC85263.1 hypothetical protein [Prolixibacteraceae bacterium]HOY91622.1 hypothetical protein [Prolixibacteraceae bacterium]